MMLISMEYRMVRSFAAIACCLAFVMLSCVGAEAAEPVRIAGIFSLTGHAAEHNAPLVTMVKLAVDEINEDGGLLNRPVELVLLDNASTPLGSAAAAEEAVRQRVTAVIGAHWSSHSLAMAPVLQQAGIPMISPASTNPEVTRVGNFIFRVCFVDSFQGEVMARFARSELGARKGCVLYNLDEPYSVILGECFTKAFTAEGGKVVVEKGYRGKAVEFTDLLGEVRSAEPDVLFVPGYTRDSGLLIKQAAEMKLHTVFLGGDAWDDIYDVAGDALNGSYQSTPWHPQVPFPRSRHLQALYRERMGAEVTNLSAPLAYDAVMLLADAVRRAGSLDRMAIRNALAQTDQFEGATGTISFGHGGDPLQKDVIILKYEKGGPHFYKVIRPQGDSGAMP